MKRILWGLAAAGLITIPAYLLGGVSGLQFLFTMLLVSAAAAGGLGLVWAIIYCIAKACGVEDVNNFFF